MSSYSIVVISIIHQAKIQKLLSKCLQQSQVLSNTEPPATIQSLAPLVVSRRDCIPCYLHPVVFHSMVLSLRVMLYLIKCVPEGVLLLSSPYPPPFPTISSPPYISPPYHTTPFPMLHISSISSNIFPRQFITNCLSHSPRLDCRSVLE